MRISDWSSDVCSSDLLTATGMAAPELRAELRKIDDVRNVGSVLLTWAHAAVTIGAAVWIDHPLAYAAAFVFMGPVLALFALISHEEAHTMLFTNKQANHFVGQRQLAYPAVIPLEASRRGHFSHPTTGQASGRATGCQYSLHS